MNVPKQFVLIGVVVLAGCARPLNPVELATKCIRDQIPVDKHVSTTKAQAVIARCQQLLDAWSRHSVEGASGKPFAGTDAAIFAMHRQAEQRYWLRQLSAEYANAHPKYD